ncbi:HEAT repeat domain-containing protein [Actinophytocola sp. KF-1]
MAPDRTPRQRVEAEAARRGRERFAAGCVRLLRGDDADVPLILQLGGRTAPWALDPERDAAQRYWFRVWAARGLLWAWHDSAAPALRQALRDEAWRVREMAAKVVARHLLGDLLADVAELRDDPVPRVRAAATRAVDRITRASA